MIVSTTPISIAPTWISTNGAASRSSASRSARVGRCLNRCEVIGIRAPRAKKGAQITSTCAKFRPAKIARIAYDRAGAHAPGALDSSHGPTFLPGRASNPANERAQERAIRHDDDGARRERAACRSTQRGYAGLREPLPDPRAERVWVVLAARARCGRGARLCPGDVRARVAAPRRLPRRQPFRYLVAPYRGERSARPPPASDRRTEALEHDRSEQAVLAGRLGDAAGSRGGHPALAGPGARSVRVARDLRIHARRDRGHVGSHRELFEDAAPSGAKASHGRAAGSRGDRRRRPRP